MEPGRYVSLLGRAIAAQELRCVEMLFASFLVDLLTTLLVHPSFPVVRPSGTASGVYLGYLSWCEVGRTIVLSIFALKFSAHCMLYLSLAIWKVPTSAPNLLHSSAGYRNGLESAPTLFYSKKVQSELFAAEEALAKKKRKMVPGKPGQSTLGRRPSGTSTNGTT
jgi:hypothetical protein